MNSCAVIQFPGVAIQCLHDPVDSKEAAVNRQHLAAIGQVDRRDAQQDAERQCEPDWA